MRFARATAAVAAATALITTTHAAGLSMTNIAGRCADSSGFNKCWSNALTAAQQCYTRNCQGQGTCTDENDCSAANPTCVQACSCVAYASMIQCALVSCWNMVASCEYQNLAINAAEYCPLALGLGNPFATGGTGWQWIPYFPSDPSRPGACSCNMAAVYLFQRLSGTDHTACMNHANSQTQYLYTCDCCEQSMAVSSFYALCPSTNPAAVLADMAYFPYGALTASSRCASIVPSVDCTSYGFGLPSLTNGQAKWYYSGNMPANGTAALSDNTGTITAPLYPTITWALGAGLETHTAVAVTTGSAAGGSGGGGGSSSVGTTTTTGATGTGTSTGTSTATAASTSKAAAGTLKWNAGIGIGVPFAVWVSGRL